MNLKQKSAAFLSIPKGVFFKIKTQTKSIKIFWSRPAMVSTSSQGLGFESSALYYKHITIVNDDSSIVNKLGVSLTDDSRVVIYDRNMFIVQVTSAGNSREKMANILISIN